MKVSLETENGLLALNPFVERLIGNLLWGILQSLHAPGDIRSAEFAIQDEQAHIRASGQDVSLVNPFAQRTILDLLRAILKNLKGGSEIKRAVFRLERDA